MKEEKKGRMDNKDLADLFDTTPEKARILRERLFNAGDPIEGIIEEKGFITDIDLMNLIDAQSEGLNAREIAWISLKIKEFTFIYRKK